MILGKTYEEQKVEYDRLLKLRYQRRFKVFAWFPVRLKQGGKAWLQYVYTDYNVSKNKYGFLDYDTYSPDYYLEDLTFVKGDIINENY